MPHDESDIGVDNLLAKLFHSFRTVANMTDMNDMIDS
jgi:hypothetical protein